MKMPGFECKLIGAVLAAALMFVVNPVNGANTQVVMSNFAFTPKTPTINVGDSITWVNNTSTAHNTIANGGLWNSTTTLGHDMQQGETFSVTFNSSGSFAYVCSIHTSFGMTGTINVSAPNTAPTISGIANQKVNKNTSTASLSFTIGDAESPATSLTMNTPTSTNTTVVPVSGIFLAGSGANRSVTVTPASGQVGVTLITLTVKDPSNASASTSFTVTVNDPPSITAISNQTILKNSAAGPLSFTIGDLETAAGSLNLTAASTNTTLVPVNNVVFGGSASNRTVTVTPAAGQFGTTRITVSVNDGTGTNSSIFLVTVDDPPTISTITNRTIAKNTAAANIPFTV